MRKKSNAEDLDRKSKAQQNKPLHRYKIIQPFLQGEQALDNICNNHSISLRTVRRWIADYKKQGLQGLTKKLRKDKGTRRVCSLEIQQLIEGLYLQYSHLSMCSIHERLKLTHLIISKHTPLIAPFVPLLNKCQKE